MMYHGLYDVPKKHNEAIAYATAPVIYVSLCSLFINRNQLILRIAHLQLFHSLQLMKTMAAFNSFYQIMIFRSRPCPYQIDTGLVNRQNNLPSLWPNQPSVPSNVPWQAKHSNLPAAGLLRHVPAVCRPGLKRSRWQYFSSSRQSRP